MKTEKELKKDISILEIRLAESDNVTEELMHELESKRERLENIRNEKIKGILIRSQIEQNDFGEKPTKFFCNLEKSNYVKKTIYKLEKEGNLITGQKDILTEMKSYYKNLYSSKHETIENEDIFFQGQ